jgi:DNA-binding XRE family transcriptional regulator
MYALARALGCRLDLVLSSADGTEARLGLQQFGKELRAARKAAGLAQAAVAERAGVTQRTVSRAERGERNLRWSVMHALARAVNHRLDLVLGPAARKPKNGGH